MKVKNLVPNVYYRDSRDFSYLGRLFEIAFNYMKTGTDLVNLNLTKESVPAELVSLLATSLGFYSRHEYNNRDLVKMLSVFKWLLKWKGSKIAIETAITTLLNAQNLPNTYFIEYEEDVDTNESKHNIIIYLPKETTDTVLLDDIFEYILPAGFTYQFRQGLQTNEDYTTIVNIWDQGNNLTKDVQFDSGNLAQVTKVGVNTADSYNENSQRSMTYTGTVFAVDTTEESQEQEGE